jgi:hypothetical protein
MGKLAFVCPCAVSPNEMKGNDESLYFGSTLRDAARVSSLVLLLSVLILQEVLTTAALFFFSFCLEELGPPACYPSELILKS